MACNNCGQPTYYPLILSSTADGECIITEYPINVGCNCPHAHYPLYRRSLSPFSYLGPSPTTPPYTPYYFPGGGGGFGGGQIGVAGGSPFPNPVFGGGIGGILPGASPNVGGGMIPGPFGGLPVSGFSVTSIPANGVVVGAGASPGIHANGDGYFFHGGLSEQTLNPNTGEVSGIAAITTSNGKSIVNHVGPAKVLSDVGSLSSYGTVDLGLSHLNGVERPGTTTTTNASGFHVFTNKNYSGGGYTGEILRVSSENNSVYNYGLVSSNKHVATKEYVDNIVANAGPFLSKASGTWEGELEPSNVPQGYIHFYSDQIYTSAIEMGGGGYKVIQKIKDGAIGHSDLGDNAVQTSRIANEAVTNTKIASGIDATKIANGSVTNTEFECLSAVTSDIQAQFSGKLSTMDGAVGASNLADSSITNVKVATGIDAIKIADGSVSNTKFQYINSVTSNVQTQINGKLSNSAGAVGTSNLADDSVDKTKINSDVAGLGLRQAMGGEIDVNVDGNYLAVDEETNEIFINSASIDSTRLATGSVTNSAVSTGIDAAKIADGSVSNTKYQYLNSVTSNVQTQLNGKEPLITAGQNFQVYTTQSGSKTFSDPTQVHTCNFTHTTAVAAGSTAQGVYGIIHSGMFFKVPTGKTMVVISALMSVRTGSTAGTYTITAGINNKTSSTSTQLLSASSSSLSTQIHGYAEGTFSSGLVSLSAGTEWNLYTKNESSSPAAAGTLNSLTITYYYI